jgi:AcrR family transcriptional regulator
MVENSNPRGRPRSYDPDAVLDCAAEVFWANGFAGTSLDELSAAMGMGRPSIYNAFGDKEALFLRTLERFRDTIGASPLQALRAGASVREGLSGFFRQIVEYATADASHLGCLLGSVAVVTDLPSVRTFLGNNLAELEAEIVEHLSAAVERGELPRGYPTEQGARRTVNAMLSLSARARLGTPPADLLDDAADATRQVLELKPAQGSVRQAKRTRTEARVS